MKRLSVWWVLTLLCTFSIFAQNKVITVSFDPVIRLAESNADVPTDKAEENRSREERQDIISVMSGRVIRGMQEADNVDKKQDTKKLRNMWG